MYTTAQITNLTPADVMRLLRTHFSKGDSIEGVQATFVYGGIGSYEGRGSYADLVSEVALLESPHAKKGPAQLFPNALRAVMTGLVTDPSLFETTRMNKAVQKAMVSEGIGKGEIPAFHTNEAYYYALARALLARM